MVSLYGFMCIEYILCERDGMWILYIRVIFRQHVFMDIYFGELIKKLLYIVGQEWREEIT